MAIKPIYERLSPDTGSSFLFRRITRKSRAILNDGVWHYHPEYELAITLRSRGKRFVGYDISDYEEGDLVLIGESLPHCWITEHRSEQLVINFRKEFLGNDFFLKPEFEHIRLLLENSRKGVQFSGSVVKEARKMMLELENVSGFGRTISLLNLLDFLTKANDYHYLTSYDTTNNREGLKASKRIEVVHTYILNNYRKEARIEPLCQELHLTKTSLCKFIKKYTKKTFTDILTETRVSEACRLLVTSDKYVSQISYECGFKNLSNFNRSFKKVVGQSPRSYRMRFSN